MGVHDYVCFVQRNGQCLYELNLISEQSDEDLSDDEFDGCGSNSALIVFIPTTYTIRDILSWHLHRFKDFTVKEVNYSWDNWNFEGYDGYGDILSEKDKWWEQCIWESPSEPGFYLVNFEKGAYQAFVLGEARPEQIPKNYIKEVFNNRNLEVPTNKEDALNKILINKKDLMYDYLSFVEDNTHLKIYN